MSSWRPPTVRGKALEMQLPYREDKSFNTSAELGININCCNCYNLLGCRKVGGRHLACLVGVGSPGTFPVATRDPGAGCVPPLQAQRDVHRGGNAESLGWGVGESGDVPGPCCRDGQWGQKPFSRTIPCAVASVPPVSAPSAWARRHRLGAQDQPKLPVASGSDSWGGRAGLGTGAGTRGGGTGRLCRGGDVAAPLALPGGNGFGRAPLPCGR